MKTIYVVIMSIVLCCVFISACVFPVWAQEQSASGTPNQAQPANPPKVFIFVQRTDRHGKYSSREVFQNTVSDLLEYLKRKNVAIAVDEFGGRNQAESETPMETVFNIARDAKAQSVLYVMVDRPVTKWIKVTAKCFDLTGKQLWQEEASSGGGMSGGHGFEVTTTKLHALLDKRIGQPGLPVASGAAEPAAQNQ